MKFKSLLLIILIIISFCIVGKSQSLNISSDEWDEWRLKTDDGASIFIREIGTGDTVLVLHGGWGAEHSYLIDPFLKYTNQAHFIFYYQTGSLRSKCEDSLISIENHVQDVERIRVALGVDKLIIVAHSMGGFIAMSYLQKYPNHIKGLILIDPVPAKSNVKALTEDIQASALKRWERQNVIDTLFAHGLQLKINKDYSSKQKGLWHRITFSAINIHDIKNWRKVKGEFYWNDKIAMLAANSGPQEWDFTIQMKKSNLPIFVIEGDDDYLPYDFQKQWLSLVPNAELKLIPNAGHLCWIDQPQIFDQYFSEALKKIKE